LFLLLHQDVLMWLHKPIDQASKDFPSRFALSLSRGVIIKSQDWNAPLCYKGITIPVNRINPT
jgi:hypothetical protein